jgi:hypothetical protein
MTARDPEYWRAWAQPSREPPRASPRARGAMDTRACTDPIRAKAHAGKSSHENETPITQTPLFGLGPCRA